MFYHYGCQFIKYLHHCCFSTFSCVIKSRSDFVLIVKSAIKNDSKDAIGVALGITFANAVYIGLCLIGVGSILAASAPIMITLKIIGGLFLMYLGIQALRARKDAYDQFQVAQSTHSNIPKTTFLKNLLQDFCLEYLILKIYSFISVYSL